MNETIAIRDCRHDDEAALVALGEAEGMGTLEGFETTLVAQAPDGEAAGFCRVRKYDGQAYVNPIVIAPKWRRRGIGAELMRAAAARWGTLRFVARGGAVPFYRALGCEEVPWESIAREVAGDCDGCADFAACGPLPMEMPAFLGSAKPNA